MLLRVCLLGLAIGGVVLYRRQRRLELQMRRLLDIIQTNGEALDAVIMAQRAQNGTLAVLVQKMEQDVIDKITSLPSCQ